MIFNTKESVVIHILDEIKLLSFSWAKAKLASIAFGYHSWWLCPLVCLSIG